MRRYGLALGLFAVLAVFPLTVGAANRDSWQLLTPANSPSPRTGHTLVAIGNYLYLYGGYIVGSGATSELWRWDSSAGTWQQLSPTGSPPARYNHSVAVVNDKMYIAFGASASGLPLGDMWEYDPASNSWRQITLVGPAARYLAGMVGLGDGRVFMGGGIDTSGQPVADAWLGDLSSVAVGGASVFAPQQIADLPRALYGFVAMVGYTTEGSPTPMIFGGQYSGPKDGKDTSSAEIHRYDGENDQWVPLQPQGQQPTPVGMSGSAQYEEHVWVFGGDSELKVDISATQIFNVSTLQWSYGTSTPVTLAGCAAAPLPVTSYPAPLQILVFGGYQGGSIGNSTYLYTTDQTLTPVDLFSFQVSRLMWPRKW